MFEKFVDRLAKYEDLQVWAPRNVTVLLMLLGAACLLVYALFGMSYEHVTTPDGKRDIAFAIISVPWTCSSPASNTSSTSTCWRFAT